eukprot:1314498-Amphidinium_carterae.1
MDYHSIPQATRGETFLAAVNSILHYVERCDYFWVCAPPAIHKETQERKDFATWRKRGWCRLEETTNLLSRTLKMPLVVTNTSKIATVSFLESLQTLWGKPESSVACGQFSCCAFGHVLRLPDGTEKQIPCDKESIGPILQMLFDAFFWQQHGRSDALKHRLMKVVAPYLFSGFPEQETQWIHTAATLKQGSSTINEGEVWLNDFGSDPFQ